MMRMRVAHWVQRYPPALGGSEAFFARLGRFLVREGSPVTTITTNALELSAFWSPSGKCHDAGATVEDGVEVHRHRLWRCPGRRYLLKALSCLPLPMWRCLLLPCNPIA